MEDGVISTLILIAIYIVWDQSRRNRSKSKDAGSQVKGLHSTTSLRGDMDGPFFIYIIIPASPFITSFFVPWLRGWPIAIYHLILVGIIAWGAFRHWNPADHEAGNIGVYLIWGLLIIIDFPISLIIVALWKIMSNVAKSEKMSAASIPTVLFATIGTYWWYIMPIGS